MLDSHNQPRKPTLCEVGYWFKPNPRYRDVFEMWRREDPMIDRDLITQGSFQLVHDRVKSFKVTYFETLGHEAEELLEWDSSVRDALPARIKIEFTIERRRSSRNIVSDVEVDDFEGAERTYVRHFVFDGRMKNLLQGGTARMPVFPPEPAADEGTGPGGGGGGGGGGDRGPAAAAAQGMDAARGLARGGKVTEGSKVRQETGSGTGDRRPAAPPRGGQAPSGLPPGFNLGDLLRGVGGGAGGGLFGGGR